MADASFENSNGKGVFRWRQVVGMSSRCCLNDVLGKAKFGSFEVFFFLKILENGQKVSLRENEISVGLIL